ncbi:MAG: Gfo/Idh/MocA family oxidoreductase [Verrucomicrobiales bacterium]|nr:Gfo/Idh/MocA family oxidoreductase [Verrucomicrobiales bacterium]
METRSIGIIMNGVTGRMGTNQHLVRSIAAIIKQGGVTTPGLTLMPKPILCGRNEAKLREAAALAGLPDLPVCTDLDAVLGDPDFPVFFDASLTQLRPDFVRRAIAAGKAVYCEKPIASSHAEALALAKEAEAAGIKNGAVQDKLWLPGFLKYLALRDSGFFGRILSVRGEFGYWVFTGEEPTQPAQRPSWNYRAEDGGGIILDMFCHWRYLIDNLFGPITSVCARAATHIATRIGEDGKSYACTADDAAYATFETANGILCQLNSSWCVRVRRDDLATFQVDGTHGSAVVGLRNCWAQSLADTPRPVWNPDIDQPIPFFENWTEVPGGPYDNAFKIQWEHFLRHVALDEPFPWSLRESAKGVELAEAGLASSRERRWVDLA